MEIITNPDELNLEMPTAVAIGKFDGIHRGHLLLLAEIKRQRERGRKSLIFTFEPSPAVFFGWSDRRELTTAAEKKAFLARMGIEMMVAFPMNRRTAALPAEEFVTDILRRKLHMEYICAGTDLTFGAQGTGNCDLLRKMAPEYGFETKIIDKLRHGDREISSSLIRAEVERGNLAAAAALLGRNYRLAGQVMTGNRLGRTLGVPTVNLYPPGEKVLPPCGVYFSHIYARGKQYCGISNVGYKPTVSARHILGVETHIYQFTQELYGEWIEVELLSFLRPEKKLAGIEILKEQLRQDLMAGVDFFGLTGR